MYIMRVFVRIYVLLHMDFGVSRTSPGQLSSTFRQR